MRDIHSPDHEEPTSARFARDPSTLQLELFGQLAQLAEHELNMVELIDAQHELLKTQETLQRELQEAAAFVRALIPEPFDRDGLQADWVFQSSSAATR